RSEVRRITLHESKLGRPYAEPGDKRRAGSAPADGAMAIRFVERAARHLVTNPPAKASALQHRGLLCKDEWPTAAAVKFLKARGVPRHRAPAPRIGSARHRGST